MKTHFDPRHQARIVALQKLFEIAFLDERAKESSFEKITELGEIAKYDRKLAEELIHGVLLNREKIDKKIGDLAKERPLEQIPRVDLQILRLALYEGFFGKITPPKVAIDEAIELAKDFGGSASSKFVNGVLGKLI